jgi:hypothetical protein
LITQIIRPFYYLTKSSRGYVVILRQVGKLPASARREITNFGSNLIQQEQNQGIFRSRP